MNKKLIGMFVCVLLIATTLPAIGNSEDSTQLFQTKLVNWGHIHQVGIGGMQNIQDPEVIGQPQ